MDDFDPAELERIRRCGRADWKRLIPPGWERGLTPAQIAAQRREIAKWERAFETPLARRLRKEQEERKQIERERLDAEIERDVLAMKAEFASLRRDLLWAELRWKAECAERKRKADLAWDRFIAAWKRGDFRQKANFNPDQPRDEMGRWTDVGGDGDAAAADSSDAAVPADQPVQLAQYSLGTLIGQSRIFGGGWMCFYKFSFGTVMVRGANLGCSSFMPAAGVSHGTLISNDN
jgi:hypothetical protein